MIIYMCDHCPGQVESEFKLYPRWDGSKNIDLCSKCLEEYDQMIEKSKQEAIKKWLKP